MQKHNVEFFTEFDSLAANQGERFFHSLACQEITVFIRNVKTEMRLLKVDQILLPITINEGEYQNSYVCSPYGQYVEYAKTSLQLVQNPILRNVYRFILAIQGGVYKKGRINKTVIVNNFLTSTSLYPKLSDSQITAIKEFLRIHYPEHAYVFRSVNDYLDQDLISNLKGNGFNLIASRYVYITDTKNDEIFNTRIFKSDLRCLGKSNYKIVNEEEFTQEDLARVLELYKKVYLDKYSHINPQITIEFLKLAIKHKFLKFKALKKEGKIDGVIGYIIANGVIMAPFLGYDTNCQENSLYRLLCTILTLEAKNSGHILHQSSGGSFFKKIRRAEGCLEYTAVFHEHLPLRRKIPWLVLKHFINTVAIPFMKKY